MPHDKPDYRHLLGQYFLPPSVIMTKPSTVGGEWKIGRDRSIFHNCFKIRTANPLNKRTKIEQMVGFDGNVGFRAVDLSHEYFSMDNYTKKVMLLVGLTTGLRASGPEDALTLANAARYFDWLVRFREDQEIHTFSAITYDLVEDAARRVGEGYLLGLIDVEARLEALAGEAAAGRWKLPLKGGAFDFAVLAAELGVTSASISRSKQFLASLVEIFPKQIPEGFIKARLASKADASNEDVDEDVDGSATASGPVATYLTKILDVFDYLHILSSRDLLIESLAINPFALKSQRALVEQYSREGGRTFTLAADDMYRIMVLSSDVVLRYSDYIIDALRTYRRARKKRSKERYFRGKKGRQPPPGFKVIIAWTNGSAKQNFPKGTLLVSEAVKYLLAACAILVGCFAARRDGEISSLKEGCLHEEKKGLLTLDIYIEKTLMDIGSVPVPSFMRRVVSVLEDLTEDTRRATGKPWLFEVAVNVDQPVSMVSTNFNQSMNQFLNYFELPPPDNAPLVDISTHMLRRGHGNWYYHGVEGATPDALGSLYLHEDRRVTRLYYVFVLPGQINQLKQEIRVRLKTAKANRTDEEHAWLKDAYKRLSELKARSASFDEARCEAFVAKMLGLWMGKISIIGKGGQSLFNNIESMVAHAKSAIRIGSRLNDPDAILTSLMDMFNAFAKRNFFEPVIGANVWCTASHVGGEDLADAQCLKLKRAWRPDRSVPEGETAIAPDQDFASNPICIGCKFCAALDDGQLALDRVVAAELGASERGATANLRAEARSRYESIKQKLQDARPVRRGAPQ